MGCVAHCTLHLRFVARSTIAAALEAGRRMVSMYMFDADWIMLTMDDHSDDVSPYMSVACFCAKGVITMPAARTCINKCIQ